MKVQCLWNKSHWFVPGKFRHFDYLCEKCYFEVYMHYAALYTPKQFKENIETIKTQMKNSRNREWTEGEAWIVETLGFDTLVKIDLFKNNLV